MADACAREPIHIPGSVQPHGALLAIDPADLRILQAAGATARMLGAPPEALAGREVGSLIGPARAALLAGFAAADGRFGRPLPLFVMPSAEGTELQAVAHGIPRGSLGEGGAVLVLEFEQRPADATPDKLPLVSAMVLRAQQAADLVAFCQVLADEVRAVGAFDRVMVYRFLHDESGSVVAEARAAQAESFLGLRFPASDIPAQARALYLRNPIRAIPDTRYPPAALIPPVNPLTGGPLDLGQALLRSVSPVHLEYLENMGVRASLSVSLVVEGRLWGLIACHHATPRGLPYALRAALEAFGQLVSFQLAARLSAASHAARLRVNALRETLIARVAGQADLASAVARIAPDLMEYLRADGVAVWTGDATIMLGRTPDHEQHRALVDFLARATETGEAREGVLVSAHLAAQFPPAAAYADRACGIAALALSPRFRDGVIWFRREVAETITWAGKPDKRTEGDRLRPRVSFALWRQSVRGHSHPWSEHETDAVRGLRVALLDTVLRHFDTLATEREAARRRQEVLIGELDHRMKNMLATVHALVAHQRLGGQDMAGFVETFEARLRAMGLSHGLLTQHRWEGASLRAVAAATLAPYTAGAVPLARIEAAGDAVLKPKAALALSLALHELATNAVKYGALSVPGGRVRLDWHASADPASGEPRALVVEWCESGGPAVREPTRRGFGRHLIESHLSYEVDALVRLDFRGDGLRFTARLPWEQVVRFEPGGSAPASPGAAGGRYPGLRGKRILVVEDNALVASSVSLLLHVGGMLPVGPAGRLPHALELAERAEIDAAVLDVDIHGAPVWPVADMLDRRGIALLLATGYAPNLVPPTRFADRVVLTKPYGDHQLFDALLDILGTQMARH